MKALQTFGANAWHEKELYHTNNTTYHTKKKQVLKFSHSSDAPIIKMIYQQLQCKVRFKLKLSNIASAFMSIE